MVHFLIHDLENVNQAIQKKFLLSYYSIVIVFFSMECYLGGGYMRLLTQLSTSHIAFLF